MAGLSLLTLLDDIASVLDDVAVMSKVAARKTAAVLGDDLALNAHQVSGVRAEREVPVVWGVAKGSFKNKLILVPAALLISSIAPWVIMPLLLIGGLFLCFEGAEKIFQKYSHNTDPAMKIATVATEQANSEDLVVYEQQKIKGAIRTDFILSAEIIVISLGTVQEHPLLTQFIVMSLIAVLMTIFVYGVVICIVKLDDLGFYLQDKQSKIAFFGIVGRSLISIAPKLMRLLTIVGTIAMFLVGGGIVIHNIPIVHHFIATAISSLPAISYVSASYIIVGNALIGLICGFSLIFIAAIWKSIKKCISLRYK
ncbi:DUF808 domain-containing protein [Psychromonas antarctica]|uniref:DUF808 domain-containing protein n=1 Tax=Psychromonas antarctica TaxID=67573 RepID=UPI001EE850F0|nr:DUF808 domain-containing protein [Psychromonas antarctica]MCG6202007.1 DUF808 domain-containing protein [Psychromonas antarctica]